MPRVKKPAKKSAPQPVSPAGELVDMDIIIVDQMVPQNITFMKRVGNRLVPDLTVPRTPQKKPRLMQVITVKK